MEGESTKEMEEEGQSVGGRLERGLTHRREEVEEQGSARCGQVPTCPAGAVAWGWAEAGKAGTG